MGSIALCTPELSDDGIIATTSNEQVGFLVTMLQNIQPTKIWRTKTLTDIYLEIDLGSVQDFSMVALLYTNATSAATWQIRTANTQAELTAAPDYDSTLITFWPTTGLEDWDRVSGFHFPSTQTNRWVRIDIVDAANPDGYFQSGRLYVANMWQPTVNMSYGGGVGFDDDSGHNNASGGPTIITTNSKRRILNFELGFLSETEMYNNAFSIDLRRGSSKDILVIPDPSNNDQLQNQSVYGLMKNLQPIINARYGIFKKRYTVTEMI